MKNYRKKGLQGMEKWRTGMPMKGISISQADKDAGSPKHGDMIAINASDHSDKWLVAKAFFDKNYEEAT